MRLVVAEKPSVAMAISKVLGADTRREGYYEGNGVNGRKRAFMTASYFSVTILTN